MMILMDARSINANCPASGFEYHGRFSQSVVNAPVRMLIEAGFLDGDDVSGIGQDDPAFVIHGLTWKGYDLVDHAAHSPSIWESAKAQAISMSLDMLREWLKSKLL